MEEERVCMKEERVLMAQNTMIISSESLSSDGLLESSSVESSGSGRRQIPTKTVMSSNKSSTFCPHFCQMTCQKHRQMTHLMHVQDKNQQST